MRLPDDLETQAVHSATSTARNRPHNAHLGLWFLVRNGTKTWRKTYLAMDPEKAATTLLISETEQAAIFERIGTGLKAELRDALIQPVPGPMLKLLSELARLESEASDD